MAKNLFSTIWTVEGLYGRLILCVGLLVVVLDQISKLMVEKMFSLGEQLPVVDGFFDLTLTYNKGVAFGMFASLDQVPRVIALAGAISLALLVVAYLLLKEYRRDPIGQVFLAMIVGGAIGNIIDRVRVGAVVDFLDFYYGSFHWPAFNIADSAICAGVFLLLFRKAPA